jgi:hypothetical protein
MSKQLFAFTFSVLAIAACSHHGMFPPDPGGSGVDGGPDDPKPMDCTDQACPINEVCAGGSCCPAMRACGSMCCGANDVCSFGACVQPGAPCIDSTDCGPNEYCDTDLAPPQSDAGDGSCGGRGAQGRCVQRPPYCGSDAGTDGGTDCLDHCESHPAASPIAPKLAYSWGGQITSPWNTDVMMTPVVVQLDDDDCDGKITSHDIPEIVFATFRLGWYQEANPLHAISIVGKKVVEKWTSDPVFSPIAHVAGGNIDGKPGNEIVGCTANGKVRALHGEDGTLFWESAAIGCSMPSIADLDQDGMPEVIVDGGILDGATGMIEHALDASSWSVVSDVDGDGFLDVVTASQVFDRNGKLVADTGVSNAWWSMWPAIGDLDLDGKPEIVVVDNLNHRVLLWRYDANAPGHAKMIRSDIDIFAASVNDCPPVSQGSYQGGGPPTIADFNGDGTPDVGVAIGVAYGVLDGKKLVDPNVPPASTILWKQKTIDCSSAYTGSSVFDFNGDGRAEVVYGDEQKLHVYDGTNGSVLWETCSSNGTSSEYPIIADVDGDGHADIVAVSNAYAFSCNGTKQSGISIFSSSNVPWVRTRAVWNEHAYHITNVQDDGTIPKKELPNWKQPNLNDFRQNKAQDGEFRAPDAIVSVSVTCPGSFEIAAAVRNVGEAALPAGVMVGFYATDNGAPIKLGAIPTTKALQPLQSETLVLVPSSIPQGVRDGIDPVYAIVDDGTSPHPAWVECRTDNNRSQDATSKCPGPK